MANPNNRSDMARSMAVPVADKRSAVEQAEAAGAILAGVQASATDKVEGPKVKLTVPFTLVSWALPDGDVKEYPNKSGSSLKVGTGTYRIGDSDMTIACNVNRIVVRNDSGERKEIQVALPTSGTGSFRQAIFKAETQEGKDLLANWRKAQAEAFIGWYTALAKDGKPRLVKSAQAIGVSLPAGMDL